MRKLLKWMRWGAFAIALAVDSYVFYAFRPDLARQFACTGIASLILFVLFVELARLVRGRKRLREFLEAGERKVHETGLHWVWLFKSIRADKAARRWIGYPVLIAFLATLFEAAWLLWLAASHSGLAGAPVISQLGSVFQALPAYAPQAAAGLYIPLILAIPPAISHVANWSSQRYVITPIRVINQSGIFAYHMRGILLARVVDVEQDYSFWEQLFGYGDIVFRETAGASEKLECVRNPKKFAKIATQYSHALNVASAHAATADGDG